MSGNMGYGGPPSGFDSGSVPFMTGKAASDRMCLESMDEVRCLLPMPMVGLTKFWGDLIHAIFFKQVSPDLPQFPAFLGFSPPPLSVMNILHAFPFRECLHHFVASWILHVFGSR